MITQEDLHKRFVYDPETGIVTNRYDLSPTARKGDVSGCIENNGYLTVRVNGKQYSLHRLIWLYHYGVMPTGHIDHVNRDRKDNRISNLRDTTVSLNCHNKPLTQKGYRQVPSGRYLVVMKINNKQHYFGTYDTPEEATKAYLEHKERLQP